MTTAQQAQLCRITVFGPGGRADLAVPVSVTVASLLPTLVAHTTRNDPESQRPDAFGAAQSAGTGSWVLQRLGEQPLDPDGTPETLDWLEAEEFYLRPADNPMPELAFDDIADGMATAVGRRPDRWRPAFTRWLFLGAALALYAVLALVLLGDGADATSLACSAAVGGLLVIGSMVVGKVADDAALTLVLGTPGCGFVGLAAAIAPGGVGPAADLQGDPLSLGGLGAAGAAAAVLAARQVWSLRIPVVPFALTTLAGIALAVGLWLHLDAGFAPAEAAGLLATFFLAALMFAPKIAIRAARLRGPELPRTAEELQADVGPLPAETVTARTWFADRLLTVVTVGAAMVFGVAFPFLAEAPGWAPPTLIALFSLSALTRARSFLGAWQRGSLALAGSFGLALLVVGFGAATTDRLRIVPVAAVVLLIGVVLLAMMRPTRRLLPVWGHVADIGETVLAIAVLPVLLQLVGVYAWARGLGG